MLSPEREFLGHVVVGHWRLLTRHCRPMQIIAIRDILPPVNVGSFNDVYVVSELMDTDLHQADSLLLSQPPRHLAIACLSQRRSPGHNHDVRLEQPHPT